MPGNLGEATFGETGRVPYEPGKGQYYTTQPGDVIWTTAEAARAWNVSRETVTKYCLAGRCRHIVLNERTCIVLQSEKPAPAEPGTLTPEQREAMGKGSARSTALTKRGGGKWVR